MKIEYLQTLQQGHSIMEILNPSTGEVICVMSILEYNVDISTNELLISGMDMTLFFSEGKYIGGTNESFANTLTSFTQKADSISRKFSKHFPFNVYTGF